MNVILLGAPGSGKGTEASLLAKSADMLHVSTGDIFRAEISARTELGIQADSFISKGQLVPDSITLGMVRSRLDGIDKGFLFDGFPRSIPQAEGLDSWFREIGRRIDAVVFLDVSDEVIVRRIVNRRSCAKCGKIYNIITLPPKSEGICDVCGGELLQRSDDNEEVVRRRLDAYRQKTAPLVEYYKKSGIFFHVRADGTPQSVHADVLGILGIK